MPLTGNPSHDISEMSRSPNHKKRVRKFGKKKARQMEIAAAMRAKDERAGKRSGKRKATRKTKRKAKRSKKRSASRR